MSRFLLTSAAIALSAGMAHADYTLHIIHINDLHSRIEPVSKYDSTCGAEDDAEGKCFGGVARVATKINELRDELTAAGENVLVMDAGDQFQGSLMYTTYKGEVEAEMMERIGFDVMAVGNHEFDDGPEALSAFVDKVSFPVISGNLDVTASNVLAGKIDDHIVLEAGGEKIGIVSALATDTVDTSSPGPNVKFEDEITALKADVAALEAEGVNKIIALTHVGLPADMMIAEAVPGIDAVVGGHSHTYLSATDKKRQGAYPTYVSQEDGTLVPIVQAYAYSKYVGHLVLTFADDGSLLDASGDTILLDASVAKDEAISARVAELAGPIEELKSKVIGATDTSIEGAREVCRTAECPMGNLVADAMLDRVKDQGVSIAIQNGGGLRASIDAGEITMGEVLTVLPFQNTLSTFEVTGAEILEALENGVSQVEEVKGRFPQVAGMTFTWDPSAPAGSRIVDVMVAEGDGFVPLDAEKTYGVVTNNYVRNGGDGYRMFAGEDKKAYDFGPDLADVTAEFITAKGDSYTPYTDGRIATK
ncbi:multifunctional 2',3'-cyclic-nucleotide 2'-phosphodiesterase/5'-nucleotidase/3'-nucleotidase [Aliishimia ponticola]|uniref:Multifunctional 2',3'-cyclic-nucleotide 2'-phosphodiesterase/5'-nucleotidase/3'-nucleotidase n=1 Tax=Aliishimia ponticola TaxID=2499833 RepID=A0A4S4NCG0_9RHOB|nr:5'-nucleotidase C-terminal domain-containing protein [Aliishimia ponticola]THH37116.1 multifunctional 2',3'-cyclic-nucleotide 2'-phosphodiesterase/5'-nucleotidase/3'-nucleotidase [Aliishimia ponticola]